jgi:hypothetical protein
LLTLPCKPDIVKPHVYRVNDWVERGGIPVEYFSNIINEISEIDGNKIKTHNVTPEQVLKLTNKSDVIPAQLLADEF